MVLATFRIRYPEFALAQDAYVQGYLDAATARVDADAFGETHAPEAIGMLAAHLMALTPAGTMAGMSKGDGDSRYHQAFKRLCREVLGGPQVL